MPCFFSYWQKSVQSDFTLHKWSKTRAIDYRFMTESYFIAQLSVGFCMIDYCPE